MFRHSILVFITVSGLALVLGAISLPESPEPAPAPIAADTFTVDSAHSTMIFRIRHNSVSNFYGRVNMPAGSFRFDDANASNSTIEVTVEIKNVDGGEKNRDLFLKSPDFFNAREYRTAGFKSNSIRRTGDGTYEATGDFTLRGVTKEITVTLEDYTTRQVPRFGFRAGFETSFTINRSDYGMDKMIKDGSLGDEVRITLAIQGVRQ